MNNKNETKGNPLALLPIGIFVILYLGTGIIFEYVLKIDMGFYQIPVVVVFLIALFVACLQNSKLSFDNKLEIMGKGVGDKNIVMMLLIFLEAGIFVGVVGRGSAQSVAYFLLSIIPPQFAIAVLFVVACLVSISMGTSVGTITLIVPIGVNLAITGGFSVPLCVGAIMGGAMFGDNLSFISDTTIAACNGQGCAMKDKFKENFLIALPAAVLSLIAILVISFLSKTEAFEIPSYNLIQIIPYIVVFIGGIVGINVLIVLLLGIVSGAFIMILTGASDITAMIGGMGSGAAGMFETSMVAILVAAICALIKHNGGFEALLNWLYKIFKGYRGGLIGTGILVVLLDIATANNTVAIVMANPIAKEMSDKYGITPRKTASILDTFSCIAQGILPYGAQMLVALSAANSIILPMVNKFIEQNPEALASEIPLQTISAFNVIPFLFYPFLLLISSLVFIFIGKKKSVNK